RLRAHAPRAVRQPHRLPPAGAASRQRHPRAGRCRRGGAALGPRRASVGAASLGLVLGEQPWWRLQTWSQAQPELRNGLRRVERFLGLVALLSLLVGGIGVAQRGAGFLASRLDAVAVLKCLGVRPREVFVLYLGQCLLLGLAGGIAGGL